MVNKDLDLDSKEGNDFFKSVEEAASEAVKIGKGSKSEHREMLADLAKDDPDTVMEE